MMKKRLEMKQMMQNMEKKKLKKPFLKIKISFKIKKLTKRTPDYPKTINGNKDKFKLTY